VIGIGYPNLLTSNSSVSGGSWNASLPVTNIRITDLSRVARSTDATTGSTVFIIDHGAAVGARGLALVAHNLSADATVQWQRGTTSGAGDVADSTALAAWAITPKVRDGRAHNVIVVQSAATSARYDTVRIVDTGNADGYVEIGAAFVGELQVPTYNAGYGLQDGLVPVGAVERSPAGALWANGQRTLRTVSMVLEASPLPEADEWHETLRCASITEWVLYVMSLTDRAQQQRYGFVGTFSELSAVEYPYPLHRRVPLKLTEVA
jgi:hypothetical protein